MKRTMTTLLRFFIIYLICSTPAFSQTTEAYESAVKKAETLWESGKRIEAESLLLSIEGDKKPSALFQLAYLYENVTPQTESSSSKSFELYLQAAELGEPASQYNLGHNYRLGKGTEKNPTKAVYWYKKSALQDYADAQNSLAISYHYGEGVEADKEKALKWYILAANNDYPNAQNVLGAFYEMGFGSLQIDETKAAEWKQRAANNGNLDAMLSLSLYYTNGFGVKKSSARAHTYILLAANSGHRFSQLKLGVAYITGEWKFSTDESAIPVAPVKKGWELIQMAADQGDPDAIFMLENKEMIMKDINKSATQINEADSKN